MAVTKAIGYNTVLCCRFPVESMVIDVMSGSGNVLTQINANDLLDSGSQLADTIL